MYKDNDYDIIVIGAGHAGCEAALAAARLGFSTCLFTMNLDTIAQMSCNPAIGGLAKGHPVPEIKSLGGGMAQADDRVKGVLTSLGTFYHAKAVIVTTGTFLKGLMHIGFENFPAGRAGEFPSVSLSDSLRELGLKIGRLKTGTPPRLDVKTIDFSKTEPQWGDDPPQPFSYSTEKITNPQLPCYMTYTNAETHKIILSSLDR